MQCERRCCGPCRRQRPSCFQVEAFVRSCVFVRLEAVAAACGFQSFRVIVLKILHRVRHSNACSRTPPPQAPSVSSEVRGSIFVIGTLKGGRVVQVEVERTSLKGVTDRRVMRAFVQAIETAMKEGYVCVGDDVQIRQEFYFDIR